MTVRVPSRWTQRSPRGYLGCALLLLLPALPLVSWAQITLDGSLGPGGALTGPNYVIPDSAGQTRGSNLFHSFGQFNVLRGERATFTGPHTIHNILSRVTGGAFSLIDGQLRSEIQGANLFLLNPSGVLFGPNAGLDISGSFHVSTTDYLRLTDGTRFSARLSDTSPLSMAPPEAFGFLGPNPAPLAILGSALQVPEVKTLSVVGGDLTIVGGSLRAPSGQVHIASVASAGEVRPGLLASPPELDVHTFERLGEIQLSTSSVSTSSNNSGGTVLIRGGHILVTESAIFANTQGDTNGAAVGVDIRVTGGMVAQQSRITSATVGAGKAGGVSITAPTITLDNTLIATGTFDQGQGGDILLQAGTLTLTGGSRIDSSSQGPGQGGMVHVRATDTMTILGRATDVSDVAISSDAGSIGRAGSVSITTPTFIMDGAVLLSSSTTDQGRGGDITVNVERLTLTGGAQMSASTVGSGPGGTVTVRATEKVAISGRNDHAGPGERGSSGLSSFASNSGDAGQVSVTTPLVTIADEGLISASTIGAGKAGTLIVKAGTVSLSGGAALTSNTFSAGQGGTIILEVERLSLTDGAQISSATGDRSSGRGGTVSIIATDAIAMASGARMRTDNFGTGPGGDIELRVGQLTLTGDAGIFSRSRSAGSAGAVTITAADSVTISAERSADEASGIFGNASGRGNAGRITISAPVLTVDAGFITTFSDGIGQAGDIELRVGQLTLRAGAIIDSSTFGAGRAGAVTVTAHDSVVITGRDNLNDIPSGITSVTDGSGDGGRIIISTPILTMNDGRLATTTSGTGRAGDIAVQAHQVQLTDAAHISTQSFSTGNAGSVMIAARDTLQSTQSAVITTAEQGKGGVITLTAGTAMTLTGTEIAATVTGGNQPGGSITLTAPTLTLTGSHVAAETQGAGKAGDITLNIGTLVAQDTILTSSSTVAALGDAGTVTIQGRSGPGTLATRLTFTGSTVATEAAVADGGDIRIMAQDTLRLRDSQITTAVGRGQGRGGNILIDPTFVLLERSRIAADAFGGPGGNILIVAQGFLVDADSRVSASSAQSVAGQIDIQAFTNPSGLVAPLPPDFVPVATLLRDPCAARLREGTLSTLVERGRDGVPAGPDGVLPSRLVPGIVETPELPPAGQGAPRGQLTGRGILALDRVAHLWRLDRGPR